MVKDARKIGVEKVEESHVGRQISPETRGGEIVRCVGDKIESESKNDDCSPVGRQQAATAADEIGFEIMFSYITTHQKETAESEKAADDVRHRDRQINRTAGQRIEMTHQDIKSEYIPDHAHIVWLRNGIWHFILSDHNETSEIECKDTKMGANTEDFWRGYGGKVLTLRRLSKKL